MRFCIGERVKVRNSSKEGIVRGVIYRYEREGAYELESEQYRVQLDGREVCLPFLVEQLQSCHVFGDEIEKEINDLLIDTCLKFRMFDPLKRLLEK